MDFHNHEQWFHSNSSLLFWIPMPTLSQKIYILYINSVAVVSAVIGSSGVEPLQ